MRASIRMAEEDDLSAVRNLCRDYRALLIERTASIPGFVEAYYGAESFDVLLAALPEVHARPGGAILVAERGESIVGCAMNRRVDAETVEIKRIFVDPMARGGGIARALVEAAAEAARSAGYRRMVLDTVTTLAEAVRMYEAMGFRTGAPFYDVDPRFAAHVRFYERDLS